MDDFWKPIQSWATSAWQAAVIAAVAAVLAFVVSHSTAFEDLRSWTFDFVAIHANPTSPSPDIIFVDFDEETFDRINKYPIPRSTIAEVVKRVGAQNPRVIGLDIFLSEARSQEEDQEMQAALTSARVVILISQDSVNSLPPVVPLPIFCQPEDPTVSSGFCTDGAPGALGYAFINLPLDGDGFVRQSVLFGQSSKALVQSFPLTLAQQYTGKEIKPVDAKHATFNGHDVYYEGETRFFRIGSWGRSPLTHIPAWKFLTGEIAPNAVTDKLVVIGQSNDAARDRFFTPIFRSPDKSRERPRMAGTEILGTAIRSLIDGAVVRSITEPQRWTMVVLLCWLAAFFLLRFRTAFGVLSVLLLIIAPFLAALVLYAKYRFWLSFLASEAGVAISIPLTLGWKFVTERIIARAASEERRELMSLFSSYVDPAVANTIWQRRDEVSLAGEQRTATVMFTDIRNFTNTSSGKPPAEVLRWLNRYLTAMDEVIREHGGFLNKFIGDGLMVIFGLPLSRGTENDAERAMRCGLAMLARVEVLNRQNMGNPAMPQLRIGIGIHTGSLMAGSIGSATRQEYSVIGETVNLASRLESLNKPYKTEILVSHTTYDLLSKSFPGFRPLGKAEVKGLDQPVDIFTVDPAAVTSS